MCMGHVGERAPAAAPLSASEDGDLCCIEPLGRARLCSSPSHAVRLSRWSCQGVHARHCCCSLMCCKRTGAAQLVGAMTMLHVPPHFAKVCTVHCCLIFPLAWWCLDSRLRLGERNAMHHKSFVLVASTCQDDMSWPCGLCMLLRNADHSSTWCRCTTWTPSR